MDKLIVLRVKFLVHRETAGALQTIATHINLRLISQTMLTQKMQVEE